MTKAERLAYDQHLRHVAKRLGLPLGGNLQEAIIAHCKHQIEQWIAKHRQPKTLSDLLRLVAGSINLDVEEISGPADLKRLLKRIPPDKEPVMAQLGNELDDKTDAIIIQRQRHDPWERPFLAVINCEGWHAFRKYFSTWHEIVHLLLDGQQLRLAFRRTPTTRQWNPEEVLVDRVAAVLGFYPPMFEPVLRQEMKKTGRLTFEVVDQVRKIVAPEASRHATVLACLRNSSHPVYFIRANMGYKKNEEEALANPQSTLFTVQGSPKLKLRVLEAASSPAIELLGIRIHKNMQVPTSSLISSAFNDLSGSTYAGYESIDEWRTSASGPIGYGDIYVEAVRYGEEVWTLIRFY